MNSKCDCESTHSISYVRGRGLAWYGYTYFGKGADLQGDGKREKMHTSEKLFNWAEDVDASSSVGFDHITPPANADMSIQHPLCCPLKTCQFYPLEPCQLTPWTCQQTGIQS